MSNYRIKKVTSKYGTESFTAQFRFLGLWFDYSGACPTFEAANDYVETSVYRDSFKGAREVVEYLAPDLSRLRE